MNTPRAIADGPGFLDVLSGRTDAELKTGAANLANVAEGLSDSAVDAVSGLLGGKEGIDYDFISSKEGGLTTVANVPDAENSESGVTISAGFDLGARNKSDLEGLGLSESLIEKFDEYLGRQGVEAEEYLKENPLSITISEAKEIYTKVKEQSTTKLTNRFNNDSSVNFSDIPSEWQTVITSVEYQYGSAKAKTPTFWGQVTTQNWDSALSNLDNFGDRYPTRRKSEAAYIRERTDG